MPANSGLQQETIQLLADDLLLASSPHLVCSRSGRFCSISFRHKPGLPTNFGSKAGLQISCMHLVILRRSFCTRRLQTSLRGADTKALIYLLSFLSFLARNLSQHATMQPRRSQPKSLSQQAALLTSHAPCVNGAFVISELALLAQTEGERCDPVKALTHELAD